MASLPGRRSCVFVVPNGPFWLANTGEMVPGVMAPSRKFALTPGHGVLSSIKFPAPVITMPKVKQSSPALVTEWVMIELSSWKAPSVTMT